MITTMKKILSLLTLLILFSCGQKQEKEQATDEQPTLEGVCGYLTKQEIENALGVNLVEAPAEINEEYLGGRGCAYSGVKEDTEAHFGYVIFTSAEEFNKVRLGEKTEGVGDEAYTINGPDAQQLWVRQADLYVMIAIGDAPKPEASQQLAHLVLQRLKAKPLEK